MSALIFVGGLVAVAAEMAAIGDKGLQSVRGMQTLQRPYLQGFTLSC